MNTNIPITATAANTATAAASLRARLTAWPRLTAAVRAAIAADTRDTTAPYGFATRVVARALGPKHAAAAPLIVRYATRAFGIACLLAILLVSINLGTILRDISDEAAVLGAIPVETADIDIIDAPAAADTGATNS